MASAGDTAPVVAADQVPAIEADDAYDADSSLGSEGGGSSYNYGSVTSSIYNYRQENGRTYHAYSDGSKFTFPLHIFLGYVSWWN